MSRWPRVKATLSPGLTIMPFGTSATTRREPWPVFTLRLARRFCAKAGLIFAPTLASVRVRRAAALSGDRKPATTPSPSEPGTKDREQLAPAAPDESEPGTAGTVCCACDAPGDARQAGGRDSEVIGGKCVHVDPAPQQGQGRRRHEQHAGRGRHEAPGRSLAPKPRGLRHQPRGSGGLEALGSAVLLPFRHWTAAATVSTLPSMSTRPIFMTPRCLASMRESAIASSIARTRSRAEAVVPWRR